MKTHTESEGGQAVLFAVVFFVIGSLFLLYGIASPVLSGRALARAAQDSQQSFFASEGSLEDAVYRAKNVLPLSSVETLALGGAFATTTVTSVLDTKEIVALGESSDLVRVSKTVLQLGEGANFNFGLQADAGGIILENNSEVVGSVYTNGTVFGFNSNLVRGEVISAGPAGVINGVHSTSSAYAHTIQNSTIGGNAYYQTISGSTVTGTLFSGSTDQPTTTLPISDEMVEGWKSEAAAAGTISSPCPYTITSGTVTLGPTKINCDLNVTNTATITLAGPLWVSGNINFANTATFRVGPSLQNKSVPIIADNPGDRLTSSKITLQNSTTYIGNGTNSFILLLSQNRSAEAGGGEEAIEVKNSASGAVLVYAGHGEVELENSVNLKEVTAYRIRAKNSAKVIYESGLANLLFTAGPSAGFSIESWKEVE